MLKKSRLCVIFPKRVASYNELYALLCGSTESSVLIQQVTLSHRIPGDVQELQWRGLNTRTNLSASGAKIDPANKVVRTITETYRDLRAQRHPGITATFEETYTLREKPYNFRFEFTTLRHSRGRPDLQTAVLEVTKDRPGSLDSHNVVKVEAYGKPYKRDITNNSQFVCQPSVAAIKDYFRQEVEGYRFEGLSDLALKLLDQVEIVYDS